MQYYIQRTNGDGDCLSWRRKGGKGFSADLSEAQVFEEGSEEFIALTAGAKHLAWPKEYIDAIACPHVDAKRLEPEKAFGYVVSNGDKQTVEYDVHPPDGDYDFWHTHMPEEFKAKHGEVLDLSAREDLGRAPGSNRLYRYLGTRWEGMPEGKFTRHEPDAEDGKLAPKALQVQYLVETEA